MKGKRTFVSVNESKDFITCMTRNVGTVRAIYDASFVFLKVTLGDGRERWLLTKDRFGKQWQVMSKATAKAYVGRMMQRLFFLSNRDTAVLWVTPRPGRLPPVVSETRHTAW